LSQAGNRTGSELTVVFEKLIKILKIRNVFFFEKNPFSIWKVASNVRKSMQNKG
jgi:hypothetical protein